MKSEFETIVKEQNVSIECAADISYLRTRARHTSALEQELISLHKTGKPPNMMEFGSTEQTRQNLLNQAMDSLS